MVLTVTFFDCSSGFGGDTETEPVGHRESHGGNIRLGLILNTALLQSQSQLKFNLSISL